MFSEFVAAERKFSPERITSTCIRVDPSLRASTCVRIAEAAATVPLDVGVALPDAARAGVRFAEFAEYPRATARALGNADAGVDVRPAASTEVEVWVGVRPEAAA